MMLRLGNEMRQLTMKDTHNGHRECEFELLPDEIVLYIFSSLNQYDLRNAALVCKRWFHVSRDIFMKEIVIDIVEEDRQKDRYRDRRGKSRIWGLKMEFERIKGILSRATMLKNLTIHNVSENISEHIMENVSTLLQVVAQSSGSKLEKLEMSFGDTIIFNLTEECTSLLEKNCTNLKSLIIESNYGSSYDDAISTLTNIKSLENIRLSFGFSPSVLPKHIINIAENCSSLQKIDLHRIKLLNDDCVDTLIRLRKGTLKVLKLKGYHLTDNAFSNLSDCVRLEEFELYLWSNTEKIGSQVLTEISKLTTLKKLIYSMDPQSPLATLGDLSNDFIAMFNTNNLSSLTHLDFSGCIDFDDEGLISAVQVCQGLRKLVVDWCKDLTDEGVLFMMSKCKQLRSLSCQYLGLTDKILDNILQKLPKLMYLFLMGCPNISQHIRNRLNQANKADEGLSFLNNKFLKLIIKLKIHCNIPNK